MTREKKKKIICATTPKEYNRFKKRPINYAITLQLKFCTLFIEKKKKTVVHSLQLGEAICGVVHLERG